ncbi:MAG TPA: hypothetical protein VHN80_14255 [Kineosporiaceae bacterium]|nr:hypothetical protein [Kineosporiaceae bacterium]
MAAAPVGEEVGRRAWLHLSGARLEVSAWDIARSVLIFLGIPLAADFLSRRFSEQAKGRDWYEDHFLPRVGPATPLRAAVHHCHPLCPRGRRSPPGRGTWPGSPSSCWPTSP